MNAHKADNNNANYAYISPCYGFVCGNVRFVYLLRVCYRFVLAKSGDINLIHHLMLNSIRH
jgi:hypothetical protein